MFVLPLVHMMYISNHWVKHRQGKNIRLDKGLLYSVQFILFGRILTRRIRPASWIAYILVTVIVFGSMGYSVYMVRHQEFRNLQYKIASQGAQELQILEQQRIDLMEKWNEILTLQKEISTE